MTAAIETLAFAGELPWHKLGKSVSSDLGWTEMIKEAGLDWTVSLRKLFVRRPTDEVSFQLVPDYFSVVRDSDSSVLGVVGKKYTPIQNRDSFRFLDTMAGDLKYETAGALLGGRVVFALARLDQGDFAVDDHGDDQVQMYLLLANRHDGSGAFVTRLTTVRVVCMNTLTAALTEDGNQFRIFHTSQEAKRIDMEAETAAAFLGLVQRKQDVLQQYMRALTAGKGDDSMLSTFLDEMLPLPVDEDPSKQLLNNRDGLKEWYFDGPGQDLATARGTAWGLLNAATGWSTHLKSIRVQGGTAILEEEGEAAYEAAKVETRMKSALLGGEGSIAGFGFRALEFLKQRVPVSVVAEA